MTITLFHVTIITTVNSTISTNANITANTATIHTIINNNIIVILKITSPTSARLKFVTTLQ